MVKKFIYFDVFVVERTKFGNLPLRTICMFYHGLLVLSMHVKFKISPDSAENKTSSSMIDWMKCKRILKFILLYVIFVLVFSDSEIYTSMDVAQRRTQNC